MTPKIATSSDLDDRLDDDLAWRRVEMNILVNQARRVSRTSGGPAGEALMRAALAMFYAHWEGFFKAAFDAYVDFLSNQRITIDTACDELIATQVAQAVNHSRSGDRAMLHGVVGALRGGPKPRLHRLRKGRLVNTRSNLRFDVVVEISGSLGVDLPQLSTKEKLINASLCDKRNHIAHGKYVSIGISDVESLWVQVIEMMEHVRDQLSRYAADRLYLQPDPGG